MKVQLVYRPDCPNLADAREALRRSLHSLGLPTEFEELDVTAAPISAALQQWGSPTILIDGIDVGGESAPVGGDSCRLYSDLSGVPTDEQICAALRARAKIERGRW